MFGQLITLTPAPNYMDPSVHRFTRYLLPSFSFTLRGRGASTPSYTPRTASSKNCPLQTRDKLNRTSHSLIRCLSCRSDLAFHSQIISKGFHGRHGKALLVAPALPCSHDGNHRKSESGFSAGLHNIRLGATEKRQLATGSHEVADLFCYICETKLGWKYIKADEPSQKYKVGKFILEVARVAVEQGLEFEPVEDVRTGTGRTATISGKGGEHSGTVSFDSDDEDECEELFSGVWNAEEVAARRMMDARLRMGQS
ncbi:yippee zinc-binding/DNA-binding /Mis18, centromere assembly-domain-containing protein [Triangularia verruculosa]|uniref:Yippee zinc-binding/DNA-binding /Mis18, centromere assembly-domain-containing protein n=1 Tax=Triangularia verruculosa TaxID=2587418 RepID=A0AAN6XHK1_9PEZI|nr:yippee zinc-binding/DNA-binding /Mis18, centromere assembly-domain-containing protein [Triangularia verruculosa]